MARQAQVIDIVIASPGDVVAEGKALESWMNSGLLHNKAVQYCKCASGSTVGLGSTARERNQARNMGFTKATQLGGTWRVSGLA